MKIWNTNIDGTQTVSCLESDMGCVMNQPAISFICLSTSQCATDYLSINVTGGAPSITTTTTYTVYKGCSFLMTATSATADFFTWSPSTYLDNAHGPTVLCTPSSSINYTVLAEDKDANAFGCCATEEIEVTVIDLDYADLHLSWTNSASYNWHTCNTYSGNLVITTTLTYTTIDWFQDGVLVSSGSSLTHTGYPGHTYYAIVNVATGCDNGLQTNSISIHECYGTAAGNGIPCIPCREEDESQQQVESKDWNFNLFPNPTNQSFSLLISYPGSEAEHNYVVTLYTLIGNKLSENTMVLSKNQSNVSANISFAEYVPAGLYFVKCTDESGRTLTKIISLNR